MTTPTNTSKNPKHEALLSLLKEGKAEILAELEAAEKSLADAITKVKAEHQGKIESLKETLVTYYHHKFPKSKGVKETKDRKPRTKIDPIAIVAKIKTILAGGKKLNGSKLQDELGINYLTFKAILAKNSNLLVVSQDPNDKKAKLYSLKS
jgi:hypothetical protein